MALTASAGHSEQPGHRLVSVPIVAAERIFNGALVAVALCGVVAVSATSKNITTGEQSMRPQNVFAAFYEAEISRIVVEQSTGNSRAVLVLGLRYRDDGSSLIDGIRRVSKPGRRVYVGLDTIPKVRNGLGVAILSTPKGVMSDRAAREASVGGEVLCEVW